MCDAIGMLTRQAAQHLLLMLRRLSQRAGTPTFFATRRAMVCGAQLNQISTDAQQCSTWDGTPSATSVLWTVKHSLLCIVSTTYMVDNCYLLSKSFQAEFVALSGNTRLAELGGGVRQGAVLRRTSCTRTSALWWMGRTT